MNLTAIDGLSGVRSTFREAVNMIARGLLLTIALCFWTLGAFAEVKDLDQALVKANLQETRDLASALKQIQMVPAKDPETGKSVMKVIKVERGSIYDRAGIKVGDLVASGSSKTTGRAMELKNTLTDKTDTNTQNP